MLDTSRDNDELAVSQRHRVIAELDAESAAHDKEELVGIIMMVPDELSLELRELHFLAVQLTDDFRPPVLIDLRQLLGDIHLLHIGPRLLHPSEAVLQHAT